MAHPPRGGVAKPGVSSETAQLPKEPEALSRRITAPSVLVAAAVIACLGFGGTAPASERDRGESAAVAAAPPAGKGKVLGARRFLRRHARRACSTRYARRTARRLVRRPATGRRARRQARRVLRMRHCGG